MEMLTGQGIFDRVVTHLLTQNARSTETDRFGSINCAYRGERGMACAVGCLIPDELYDCLIEGESVGDIRILNMLERAGISPEVELLSDLMGTHDDIEVSDWPNYLNGIALEYKFNTNALHKFKK